MTDDPKIAALESQFYEQLGRAIGAWQGVEISLCRILHSVSPHDDSYFTAETFFAAINFRDKLSMIDVAARYRLSVHQDLLNTWGQLKEKCSKAAKRRNAIAHGVVWRAWEAGREWPCYKLSSHPWKALGPDRGDQPYLNASHLRDATDRFNRIDAGLVQLWNEIDARLKQLPKSHEPSNG